MAVKTAAELKAYFETGDKPTQSQFEDLIDTIFSLSLGTKMFLATVTSNGAGALDVLVLKNTLGYNLTSGVGLGSGDYKLTAPNGSFNANTASAFIQNQFTASAFVSIGVETDFIQLTSTDDAGTPSDNIFINTNILIIVQ